MLRIAILHVNNSYNYGNFMMGLNLIRELDSQDKVFLLEVNSDDDFFRFHKGVESKIERIRFSQKSFNNKISRFTNRLLFSVKNRTTDILNHEPDAIIILGGDDLSEYYEKWKIFVALELYYLYKLNKHVPVFLVGQTIGPYNSWRKIAARRFLKDLNIYSRDPHCAEYLRKELKVDNVFESSDLAFLPLLGQDEAKLSHGLKEENYLTLVPSGLVKHYSKGFDIYVSEWVKIINRLLKLFEKKQIVLLAHVLKPESSDDRVVINAIMERVNDKRVIAITDEMLPTEARIIVGNGIMTITGRMHAAISTFQMGKPAISLAYSVKYGGIIGEDLGRHDLIIDCKDKTIWEDGRIVDMVMDRVDYVEKNYPRLQKEIKIGVKRLQKKAMAQIEDIAKKLKEIDNGKK